MRNGEEMIVDYTAVVRPRLPRMGLEYKPVRRHSRAAVSNVGHV